MIKDDFLKKLKDHVDISHACPEMVSGLSSPREALRMQWDGQDYKIIQSMSGTDHTQSMNQASGKIIRALSNEIIHGAVLKGRSPSCGLKDVKTYKGPGKIVALDVKTSGVFAKEFLLAYPDLPIEDEGRLRNYNIRHHFLTGIYSLSYFQAIKEGGRINDLVEFQKDFKYLLMALDPQSQKILGQIVANHKGLQVNEVYKVYEKALKSCLKKDLEPGKTVNVLEHIFGYFSKKLSSDEKVYFTNQVKAYRQNQLPLPAILTLLYGWVIRFDETYLINQRIFEAYPKNILDLSDSGKGRK
jgi:uncharacterized protein YbgA (DUF1722 family)/uncharacterized protein YbbK (DUF523 family)